MENINAEIYFNKGKKPFKHFYNAAGYGNVDFTYTPPSRKMYEYLSSYNNQFEYMRMHNILTCHGQGDRYFLAGHEYGEPFPAASAAFGSEDISLLSKAEDGSFIYNWTVVDKVYDILMAHKIRPIIETISIPGCIMKSAEYPYLPSDFKEWHQLMKDFTSHLIARYGKDEVEQWYFEIWNEPDGEDLWVENPETFFALYDYMEDAVHSIDPAVKTGGPAVKQGDEGKKLFKLFLEHCANGLNYATGKFGTRLDFISCHCKAGRPESNCPSTDAMFRDLASFAKIMLEYPKFRETEFFNDESDIIWYGSYGINVKNWFNFRNTHYAPGFTCKMVNTYVTELEDSLEVNLGLVASDNCHLQWERNLFSGNRSQLTPLNSYPSTDLIKKPLFNAYVLLSRLGTERYAVECAHKGYGEKFGILPTSGKDYLSMMVWNFEDGMEDEVNKRLMEITLKEIPFRGKYKLIHYRIDKTHSNSNTTWAQLGRPTSPSPDEIRKIRENEGLELYTAVMDVEMQAELPLSLEMPMHSVSLLLFVPQNDRSSAIPVILQANREKGFNDNSQVFLKWTPCADTDFLYYRIFRRKQGEEGFKIISDNTSVNTSTYIDMDVDEGSSYFYKIQSLNASYVESECSEEFKEGR